jgi:hypothetical protein
MQLTKHAYACVTLSKDGARIVIDPGTFTPDAADAVAEAEVVLMSRACRGQMQRRLVIQHHHWSGPVRSQALKVTPMEGDSCAVVSAPSLPRP